MARLMRPEHLSLHRSTWVHRRDFLVDSFRGIGRLFSTQQPHLLTTDHGRNGNTAFCNSKVGGFHSRRTAERAR